MKIEDNVVRAIRDAKAKEPSLSLRELGRRFGVHNTTVMAILGREPEPFVLLTPEESSGEEFNEQTGDWVYGKGYTYNGTSDTYVLILKSRPAPLVLSGDKVRAMKRAYSNWTKDPATINEICRRFALPRDQFQELKTIFGWTKDQEPYTREEVLAGNINEMVDDAYQLRRQSMWEGFEKKKWQETKAAAEKWDKLEQTFYLPLREHVETWAPTYQIPTFSIGAPKNPFAVVTNNGELHYGKAGWVGETGLEYSREIAAERLVAARKNMLEEVADRGRPEKFYLAIGNDYLHIDNEHGTTTKGTPQDCDGTIARILTEGFDLLIKDIDALRMAAPVSIIHVPGNHDRVTSLSLFKMVQAWYRKDDDVETRTGAKLRDYAVYGQTLMGFCHGDGGLKSKDFAATMADESPKEWWSATKHRAFFSGHKHITLVNDLIGITHYQMASLSGKDRYTYRNFPGSNPAMNSYILDKEHGPVSMVIWKAGE